jgi:hypothetical protein
MGYQMQGRALPTHQNANEDLQTGIGQCAVVRDSSTPQSQENAVANAWESSCLSFSAFQSEQH